MRKHKMSTQGFTLLEVALAIGLSGAVLGLLTTAINLYLVRVDTSRTQVESAQLARTLLTLIANDLRAARYNADAGEGGSSGSGNLEEASTTQGIFGTETEIRIDRAAIWQWELVAQQTDVEALAAETNPEPLQQAMPQTIRYVLSEGRELLASKLAEAGVSEESRTAGYAGLLREQTSTAAWMAENPTALPAQESVTSDAELIAPEVVQIAFQYFDGEQLLSSWDSEEEEGLPAGVEIRLTLLREPFEEASARTEDNRDELRRDQKNLVEYRLFVNLPTISEPEPTSNSPGGPT